MECLRLGPCWSSLPCVLSFPWCSHLGPWSSMRLFTHPWILNYIVFPELSFQLHAHLSSYIFTQYLYWVSSRHLKMNTFKTEFLIFPSFPKTVPSKSPLTLPQLMSILLVSQTENPGFLSFQLGNSTGSAIKIYPEKNIYIPRIRPLFLISTSSPLSEPSPVTWIAAIASLLISLLLPRPLTFCAQYNPYNGLGHCDPPRPMSSGCLLSVEKL